MSSLKISDEVGFARRKLMGGTVEILT